MNKLTKAQEKILKVLIESDPEQAYFYVHFEDKTGLSRDVLQKEMKGLLQSEYVEHRKGLFNDDGMVAGSGFQIKYSKRDEVEKIVKKVVSEPKLDKDVEKRFDEMMKSRPVTPYMLKQHLAKELAREREKINYWKEEAKRYCKNVNYWRKKRLIQKRKLIVWIAEYVYYKVNPDSKMDVPSIVYEQVEKDLGKFISKLSKNKHE